MTMTKARREELRQEFLANQAKAATVTLMTTTWNTILSSGLQQYANSLKWVPEPR